MEQTKKQTERQELIRWLEDNEKYEFLVFYHDTSESLRKLRQAKAATLAVDKVLETAAIELKKLARQYRSMGIGDTATDDAIAAAFYTLIH